MRQTEILIAPACDPAAHLRVKRRRGGRPRVLRRHVPRGSRPAGAGASWAFGDGWVERERAGVGNVMRGENWVRKPVPPGRRQKRITIESN